MASLIYPPSLNGTQKTLGAQLLAGVTAAATLNNVTGIQNKLGMMVIDRVDTNGVETPSKREYIKFTGTSGSTVVTLTRNADGSGTDQDHAIGAIVELIPDVVWAQAINDVITAEHTTAGAHTSALVTSLKATGADINTGTSDVTIVTPKAVADSYLGGATSNLQTQITALPTASSTTTFINKRIEPRVVTAASYTTDTGTSLSVATADIFQVTAQAGALKFNNPGGTPVAGQKLIIRIKDDGTARALTYDTEFRAMGTALPTTTVLGKTLYMGFIRNHTDTKWDLVAAAQEA